MSKFNQKGVIAQGLVIVILVLGLLSVLFITQKTTIFKSKAQEAVFTIPTPNVLPTSSSYPSPVACSSRLDSFSLSGPCSVFNSDAKGGFTSVKYSCNKQEYEDHAIGIDSRRACRSAQDWVALAEGKCDNLCPQPTPKSTPPTYCGSGFGECPQGYLCTPSVCANSSAGLPGPCTPGKCVPIPVPTSSPTCNTDLDCSVGESCYTACYDDFNDGDPNCFGLCKSNGAPTPTPLPKPQPRCMPYFQSYCSTTNSCLWIGQICPEPKPVDKVCIQVVTAAVDPASGVCEEFPTPCDVLPGWEPTGSSTCSP
jgi:hypothetical protein